MSKRFQHIINIDSTSIQHVSKRLKGRGGGVGANDFNIAVQQNRTDFEANAEAFYLGL